MPESETSRRGIDWSTARVENGDLTVELTGAPSPEWSERLDAVLTRLRRTGSGWDAIEVGEQRIEVAAVAEGAEPDLRHFLEGGVQQANANLARADGEADDAEPGSGSELSPEDREMTDAFRAFAQDARETEGEA